MGIKPKLLTKSRFKIGCECPTKLYFTNKPEYGNNKSEDSFLRSLAEGGFQVGELAKLYIVGGTELESCSTNNKSIETKSPENLFVSELRESIHQNWKVGKEQNEF